MHLHLYHLKFHMYLRLHLYMYHRALALVQPLKLSHVPALALVLAAEKFCTFTDQHACAKNNKIVGKFAETNENMIIPHICHFFYAGKIFG